MDDTPPTFSLFASLSAELRALIWAHAALQAFERMATYPQENREALAIDIAETADDGMGGRWRHLLHDRLDELIEANPVFYVNREACYEVLKLIERRKADGLVIALNYMRISTSKDEVGAIGHQLQLLHNSLPLRSRRWSDRRPKCSLAGKNCTRLAINMSNAAHSNETDRTTCQRFYGPEDFVVTLADLFGQEIRQIYLYDAQLGSDFDDHLREFRAPGIHPDGLEGVARIGTLSWYCPTDEEQSGTFGHLFGDVNRNFMSWPPRSDSEYHDESQIYLDEPEMYPDVVAALIRIPWHNIPRYTMSLTFGEAVRVAAGHRPAFVHGMWSRMQERGIKLNNETIKLLSEVLKLAVATGKLPKLRSISIMTPVYDWYIEESIPESEVDGQEASEDDAAGQGTQEA